MKTHSKFDYDLWTTVENGVKKYWSRVKSTGEETEVSKEIFRFMNNEDKKIRREITDTIEAAGTIYSLDAPCENGLTLYDIIADPLGKDTLENEREYGVRVNTDKYAYLMRLNPNKGEYNLYCYCYRRDWLDNHLEKASGGIRFIDSNYKDLFRIEDGDKIVITLRDGEEMTRTCRYIDQYHTEVGNELFHVCEFAERMEGIGATYRAAKPMLPEQCYGTLHTGELIIIRYGERGYYNTDNPNDGKETMKQLANEMNEKRGVTKAQAAAMLAGSMYGWSCPAANPKSYDENGTPIKPKQKDRGDVR